MNKTTTMRNAAAARIGHWPLIIGYLPKALCLLAVIVTQLSTLNPQLSAAAVFTTNFTITEADTSYDGQDLIVSGATPLHSSFCILPSAFPDGSLLLTNGAALPKCSGPQPRQTIWPNAGAAGIISSASA